MISSRIGLGPMSPQIIEAIFSLSQKKIIQLMIIASKNQIDYNGGYVNNWDTKEFMKYISKMKLKYPECDVLICRDHCGPGFNGIYELEDTYNTIKEDIECGFDLIHIDFSKYRGSKEEMLNESGKAIEYCLKLNPNIKLEIGTDENEGCEFDENETERIEEEIKFFKKICNPEFYVVQTGSLIKEIRQAGKFNKEFIEKFSNKLKEYGLKLKEHNADYLNKKDLISRKGIVDAMNIAPQLGTIQTVWTLKKCLQYGIKYDDFFEEVIQGSKWTKWLDVNTVENKMQCFLIAGHYHFASENYERILNEINEIEDSSSGIIKAIHESVEEYLK